MPARALLAIVLFALTLPASDHALAAGRGKGGASTTQRAKPKAKPKAKPNTTARSSRGQGSDVQQQGHGLHSRILGIRKARSAGKPKTSEPKRVTFLTKRQLVKDRISTTDTQLKTGQLADAASTVTASLQRQNGRLIKAGIKNPTIRERFALWRAARRVKKDARKLAKKRGAQGDADGVRDALSALKTLEANGRVGFVGRWRNQRVAKKASNKTIRAAKKQMKKGNGELTRPAAKLAVEVRGDTWMARRKLRGLKGASIKLAKKYAKQGNPQAASEALSMAQDFGAAGHSDVKQKTIDGIMIDAFSQARRMLVKEANKSYKKKDFDDAAAKLAEARRITRSVKTKTSRRTRRMQKRLARLLGPRVEKALAKQDRKTLSYSEAVEVASSASGAAKKGIGKSNSNEQVMMSNASR